MLEGRVQRELVTRRYASWPFWHGSLKVIELLTSQLRVTREYVPRDLSRRCKFPYSLIVKFPDILF